MATATPFQKEAWTEYGIGVIVLLLRLFARMKVVGIRNWQGDDYFSIIALIFWTVCTRVSNKGGEWGTNWGTDSLGRTDHARTHRPVRDQYRPHRRATSGRHARADSQTCCGIEMPSRWMDVLCDADLVAEGLHAVLLQPSHVR